MAYVGIPAFIVTLAGMLTFRGLTQMVLEQCADHPLPGATTGARLRLPAGPDRRHVVVGVADADPRRAAPRLALVIQESGNAASGSSSSLEDEPSAWFVAKTAFIALFMLGITFVLASYRGTPIVLVILAVR